MSTFDVNDRVAFLDDDEVVLGWVSAIHFDRARYRYVATVRCPRGDVDDFADVPFRELRHYG